MREIKFRAWDKFDGMLYTNENLVIIPSAFNPLDFSYNHYGRITFHRDKKGYIQKIITGHSGILMQYTGLKDKNGVEIFGEDILLDYWKEKDRRIVGEVVWEQYGWKLKIGEKLHCFDESIGNYEKIGNIHENPELTEANDAKEFKS